MKKPLWEPSEERKGQANLTRFIKTVNAKYDLAINSYAQMWDWSVQNIPEFWATMWAFGEIKASRGYTHVVQDLSKFPGTQWFTGARLNFAENLLRYRDDRPAFIFRGETQKSARMTYAELYDTVARLAMSLRDRGLMQLRGQVLIYPVLGADTETGSYQRNAEAPCLTRAEMIFYLDSFLGRRGGPNWRDPYAVPNIATDLSGLPPAFISVAAHDPLCDDGIIFHDKMKKAGRQATIRKEPALAHSFMRARHVSKPAMAAFEAVVLAIRGLAHEGVLPG